MPFVHLFPIITAAAAKGLGCGVACGGACGNPMTKMFLASYLFTHSGKLKRSIIAFINFYAGKIISVVSICVIASWLGSRIVDASGTMFGINLEFVVQLLMFIFAITLIGRWIYINKVKPAEVKTSHDCKEKTQRKLPMLVCGVVSGISPCAPLILAVGYASTLSILDAVIVGVVFSVASSILPLIILAILTGLLSGAMFKEIPAKVRYFQLGAYVLIAVMSGNTLLQLI